MRHSVARDFVLQKTFLVTAVLATSISGLAQAAKQASNQPISPIRSPASQDVASNQPTSPGPSAAPTAFTNAPTYIDYPLRKLSAAVPTLKGMKADPNQDQLGGILSKVGEAILKSLSTVPNLSSREDVYSIVLPQDRGLTNSSPGNGRELQR